MPEANAALGWIDEFRPLAIDPEIFDHNLRALREIDPTLAAKIAAADVPAGWRPARGIDAAPTWRTEPVGQPAAWLSGSAAPQTRAAGVLGEFDFRNRNVAVPGIAAGAEVQHLIEHMPPLVATFVFEPDVAHLAAVLRIYDWSAAIRSGRCNLLCGADEELFEMLRRRPGLLAPTGILRLPDTPSQRLDTLRAALERIGRAITAERRAVVAAESQPTTAPKGFAIISLERAPELDFSARALGAAAADAGYACQTRLASGPDDADLTAHMLALRASPPMCCLLIDDAPALAPPGARIVRWHVRKCSALEAELHLTATPRLLAELSGKGRRAHLWPHAVLAPGDERPKITQPAALLIADFSRREAESCAVEQPTHRMLWQGLCAQAEMAWRGDGALEPAALLARAQRSSGVTLTDEKLRDWMLDLVAKRLVPSLVAERSAELLAQAGPVGLIGRGWRGVAIGGAAVVAESVFSTEAGHYGASFCVCLARGESDASVVVQTAAGNAPMTLLPIAAELRAALAPVLNEADFSLFHNASELSRRLRDARNQQVIAAAEARAARLARDHSYSARFRQLCAWLGVGPAAQP